MSDINRLRSVLVSSGLQSKDNALYQVINELIAMVGNISGAGGGSGGGSVGDNIAYKDESNVFTENQKISKFRPELTLETPGIVAKSRFFEAVAEFPCLSENVFFNGTNWSLDNTTKDGFFIAISNGINFYRTISPGPGSANPIFSVLPTGQILERGRTTPMGEWIAWTPAWVDSSGTGGIVGNGTLSARYMLVGRTLFFSIYLIIGSTTVRPANIWGFSAPLPFAATYILGSAFVYFPGMSVGVSLNAGFFSGNLINFITAGFSNGPLSSTVPGSTASGSWIMLNGCYEI